MKIVSVLAGRCSLYAATTRGRTVFKTVLCKLLSYFAKDMWFTDLCIEDFLIMDSNVCYILKIPISLPQLGNISPKEAACVMANEKKRNLCSLWTMMSVFFRSSAGRFPLYFAELGRDLTLATLDEVKAEWFLTYLKVHFAFASSMGRKFFVCESRQVIKTHDLSKISAFTRAPPMCNSDWRGFVNLRKDYIMNHVFWYGLDLEDELVTKIELRQFESISDDEYMQHHSRCAWGLLEYKRHILQHAEEHFKKEMQVTKRVNVIKEIDEIELFASASLPEVEPYILRSIMAENIKEFQSLISCYAASLSDKNDLPQ